MRSSRTFGFKFPEKLETLSVPADNSIRLYNDKSFAPGIPNSGKQNPKESIRHSNFRPAVRPFHYGQLLAKRKVFGSKIRGDFDLRPYEQNKISKRFHHDYSLVNACNFVNNYGVYEYLRRTPPPLLETINCKVNDAGGTLDARESEKYRLKYRDILKQGEIECPEPDEPQKKGKRGRIKKSNSRNLLERLRDLEEDTLRFMDNELVPCTNNLGENDIRMTKVQLKISGCFRSMDGAKIFCRIRSYLSTCRKHGVKSSHALDLLFKGKLPDFCMQLVA